ncbi:MAG TPA: porin family protein [Mucilaginibacter sp.]|nr:porin family protein [Mucilaginibacter sp.]
MKKTLLLLALIVASMATFAQTTTFGIKAGLNSSKLTVSATGGSISTESLVGFHVGGVADIGFETFSIQPGLLFSTKGGKSTSEDGTDKITLNYLEIPVNFLYKVPAGDGKVFFGAGPYLGYGLSGKSKSSDGTSTDVTFGSTTDDVKNPDFGFNFLAGYQFSQGFALNVNYGLGLANLSNEDAGVNLKTKNQVLSFSLTYFIK